MGRAQLLAPATIVLISASVGFLVALPLLAAPTSDPGVLKQTACKNDPAGFAADLATSSLYSAHRAARLLALRAVPTGAVAAALQLACFGAAAAALDKAQRRAGGGEGEASGGSALQLACGAAGRTLRWHDLVWCAALEAPDSSAEAEAQELEAGLAFSRGCGEALGGAFLMLALLVQVRSPFEKSFEKAGRRLFRQ